MAIAEGIKYWSDNEAVRGFDANAFLMSQSVMRFESASDRDVALAQSLTEGMVAYDKSTNILQLYDGSTWQNVAVGTVGVTDHGLLTGLGDDDHPQYLTEARGDARYYTESESDSRFVNATGDTMTGNLTITSASLITNNSSPTVYFQDTDHRSAMIHVNSNVFYVLRGSGTNSLSWSMTGGRWPLEINLENNNATFGGTLFAASTIQSNTTPSGGMVMRLWPTNNAYAMLGTVNMASSGYGLLTNGVDTLIGSGTGGQTYFRGANNDGNPQIRHNGFEIVIEGGNFTLNSNSSLWQVSTPTWQGNAGSGVGKIEYHSNRWYINAGSNSSEVAVFRRGGSNVFVISNNGTLTTGIIPAGTLSGTVDNNVSVSIGRGGIAYPNATVGGGSPNQIGFRWTNPVVNCTVDNVISAAAANFSDRRLKTNINTYADGIDAARQLRSVTYNPLDIQSFDSETGNPIIGDNDPADIRIGFIADEVQNIVPSAVEGDGIQLRSIDTIQILSVAISAIQNLDKRLQMLEGVNNG